MGDRITSLTEFPPRWCETETFGWPRNAWNLNEGSAARIGSARRRWKDQEILWIYCKGITILYKFYCIRYRDSRTMTMTLTQGCFQSPPPPQCNVFQPGNTITDLITGSCSGMMVVFHMGLYDASWEWDTPSIPSFVNIIANQPTPPYAPPSETRV